MALSSHSKMASGAFDSVTTATAGCLGNMALWLGSHAPGAEPGPVTEAEGRAPAGRRAAAAESEPEEPEELEDFQLFWVLP